MWIQKGIPTSEFGCGIPNNLWSQEPRPIDGSRSTLISAIKLCRPQLPFVNAMKPKPLSELLSDFPDIRGYLVRH